MVGVNINNRRHILTIYGADGVAGGYGADGVAGGYGAYCVGGGNGAPTASCSWVDDIEDCWGYISLAVGPNYDITNMTML